MSEIPKAYEPQAVEDKWYQFWIDQKCFVADPHRVSEKRPAYSIVIPPPNVTGMLHMGHVLNNTIQDILSRKARMDGKEVLWLPGTDHAGIATQVQVEKALKKEERKTKYDLGREEFLKRVWTWKEKHGGIIINQLKKLGCSCDWTRERFTMDPEYSRCVQKVFVELYKKGLIYRGKRMVNWCPVSQTALSDEEVEMKPQKGFMYHFKVQVADATSSSGRESARTSPEKAHSQLTLAATSPEEKKGGPEIDSEGRIWLTIATTRPETIPGDTAVAVNPKDTRYAHLIGKHIIRPLPIQILREQKLIPIIGDEHVDFEFGTGVLKVTPAHDKADFEIGARHKLPLIDIMNPNGTMNTLAGEPFVGLDRFEARKVAVDLLKEQGALVEEKPYENNVGFSQRADVPIEPRLSEQWFLKYPAVEQSRACVEQDETGSARVPRADSGVAPESSLNQFQSEERASGATPDAARETRALPGKMQFHPQRWAKVYDHWLTNIQDWCISRQLWWGHRIPVWYSKAASENLNKDLELLDLSEGDITGRNIKELRASAWHWAETHGLLNRSFVNRDTGWEIEVRPSSLEHAFSNFGVANVKLVPHLSALIENAIHLVSQPHDPPAPPWKCVHLFFAGYCYQGRLHRVKIVVKERDDGRLLYDHQAVEVQKNETDGNKSPGTHLDEEKLVTRPTPASLIKLFDLLADVNPEHFFVRCQMESPGDGWEQDPDVLDTWFSSWLWPFATMGWPEKTPTLQKFYPTTDLVTGPDIIFFWVARMIMAGYEFMGEPKFGLPDAMPFKNVYFTGIIRDKQGRKMSKTLGNSPDPLVLIGQYGADALRFGTMRSAPLGQDVLFDEKDVELGRNFCNKLWNACRFRQMQGGEVEGEIRREFLTSDDKWILLKLDQAIREVTTALAEYKFSEATAALYRFFWSEFCDWYLEASKAVFFGTDAAQKENTNAVIDFILSNTLRMFHPFIPFITEELWHGMGFNRDLPSDQGGDSIMFARWPKALGDEFRSHYGLDESDLRFVEAKYELVTLGRNLRREANIQPGKKVKFIFKPAGPLAAIEAEVLRLLLNAETFELVPEFSAQKGTPSALSPLGELFLPLEGLIDVEAEKARLTKESEKIRAEIAKVEAKLNNPAFAEKVPPAVLEEHQKRLLDWQVKLQKVQASLDALA